MLIICSAVPLKNFAFSASSLWLLFSHFTANGLQSRKSLSEGLHLYNATSGMRFAHHASIISCLKVFYICLVFPRKLSMTCSSLLKAIKTIKDHFIKFIALKIAIIAHIVVRLHVWVFLWVSFCSTVPKINFIEIFWKFA